MLPCRGVTRVRTASCTQRGEALSPESGAKERGKSHERLGQDQTLAEAITTRLAVLRRGEVVSEVKAKT